MGYKGLPKGPETGPGLTGEQGVGLAAWGRGWNPSFFLYKVSLLPSFVKMDLGQRGMGRGGRGRREGGIGGT